MERPVKERLVGATILVALIVLIVPELLSGSKRPATAPPSAGSSAPTRSVSVDLTTNRSTSAPQTADLASAASAPASATAAPEAATAGGDAPSAGAVTAAPPTVSTLRAQAGSTRALETRPPAPNSPAETATSSSPEGAAARGWTVQLGSFVNRANAEKLVHQLKATGAVVYVTSSGSGPSLRYRVRTGPLPDRAAAERAAAKLKAAGHAGTIVTPAS